MVFSSKKEEPLYPLFIFFPRFLYHARWRRLLRSQSKAYNVFGFSRRAQRRWRTPRTALFILLSCCDCCGRIAVSSSPNKLDRRFRPPTRRQRYRSSLRSCVSRSSPAEIFLPTRRLCSMYARDFSHPLSLCLSSLVLDFSSGGKGEGLPLEDVGPPNDATAESRKTSYDGGHRSRCCVVSNCLLSLFSLVHCCCWFQTTTTRTTVRVVARVRARALPRGRLPGGARGARCHRPPCVRADRRLCCRHTRPPRLSTTARSARSQLVAWCRDEATRPATSTRRFYPINWLLSTSSSRQ